MAKRKTHFEQISVEKVKAIVERTAAPPVAANIATKRSWKSDSKGSKRK